MGYNIEFQHHIKNHIILIYIINIKRMMKMKGKIFCLMLIIGVIFSVSSVCAADLNDTQSIPVDDFIQNTQYIQNDINYSDMNSTDNSTDNIAETDNFNNIPKIDLDNIGVLPLEISYYMEPVIIESPLDNGTNDYCINFNFVKSSNVKNLTLHFEVDGNKQMDVEINGSSNPGPLSFIVVSGQDLANFNNVTVTVSYIINDKIKSSITTFEKSDFESDLNLILPN